MFIDGTLRQIVIADHKESGTLVKHIFGGDNTGFIESAKDRYAVSDLGVKDFEIRTFPTMKTCVEFKSMGDTPVNWNAAKANCIKAGGMLSYFDNAEELKAYHAVKKYRQEWIGIERKNGNQWFTVAGVESTVFNWNAGEPNNAGKENCVESYGNNNFKWNDHKCEVEKFFSCRFERIVPINEDC